MLYASYVSDEYKQLSKFQLPSSLILQDENDIGVPIPTVNGLLKYKITAEAIDKLVSFKCTPVREDGVFGESRSTLLQEYVQPGIGVILQDKSQISRRKDPF